MRFGDIVKCPECKKVVGGENIIIKRNNILNEDKPSYFSEEEKKLCREKDNLFLKVKCPDCNKAFRAMVVINVEPVDCFTADDNSNLVMIDK